MKLGGLRTNLSRLNLVVVLAACTLSFGLRCYYVFGLSGGGANFEEIGGDPEDFLRIAYTLSQTGSFAEPDGVNVKESLLSHQHPPLSAGDVRPTAWRPPLWPLVLAAMMRATDYNLVYTLCLRFLIDSLTVVLFYLLLLRLPLHSASRVAAVLLFAAHPAWLIYSVTFFSEPLTLFIHVLFALSMLVWLNDRRSLLKTVAAGVLAGLTVLEHPFYLFFPVLLTGWLCAEGLIKVRQAAPVLLLMCLTVFPWLARNMLLFHTARPVLTTSAGINLAKGWNPAFLGLYRDTTADVALSENVIGAEDVKLSDLNEEQKSEAYARRALSFVGGNWRLIPAIVARKLVGAIDPFPESYRGGVLEAGRTIFQLLSFLPLCLVLFLKRAGRLRTLSAALLSAYLLMSVVTMGTIRYRFPLIWVELSSLVLIIELLAQYTFRRLYPRPGNQGQVYSADG